MRPETKTNRKKLIKAYSDKSPLVNAIYMREEGDICLVSENDRILAVNSKYIPTKTTKNSQGVQVLKLKKGLKLKAMGRAGEMNLADYTVYRTRTIPGPGNFAKKDDAKVQQLTLF